MTFQSLYNWGIKREWAEDVDERRICKLQRDKRFYFLQVIRHLTELHALVLCENFDKAKIYIEQLLILMSELETADLEEKLISAKVLSHVAHVTIQKSLEKMDLHEKAKEVEKNVEPLVMTTNIEKSTLYGIRSSCLKNYQQGIQIACNFAENARMLNPDCSYWNLAYAQCLRAIRHRTTSKSTRPNILEKECFKLAYTQNTDPYFGIRLAQCYKESKACEEALQILEEIKNMPIKTSYIWLKLALGFMYYKKFEPAKECLDEAEKIDDSSMVLHHYKGLYYMKGYENYDEAMIHLKEASDQGYYNAFEDYICCLYRKNPYDRKVLELMESSTQKHKYHRFNIGLTIALYYGKNLHDYEKALIKLSDIVKENPLDPYLKDFFYPFSDESQRMSIFDYIETELLPKSRSILDPENREAWKAHNYLRNLVKPNKCRQNNFNYNWRTE